MQNATIVNYLIWDYATNEKIIKQMQLDDRDYKIEPCEPPKHTFAPGAECCMCKAIPTSRIR